MAFSIDGNDGFISKVQYGGARPTLFNVNMTLKGAAAIGVGDGSALMQYMCKGVSIPASNMGIAIVNYFGRQIKYPGNRPVVEDLTMTVINDEGYAIRNQIENWMEKLNSHFGNSRSQDFETRSNYVADINLSTYRKVGGTTDQTWTFKNCFPISLDAVPLAWDANDTIMEYSVVWKYDYWTHQSIFPNNVSPTE